MAATALTLLALAVASWSLLVMTRQLTVARSASGGRALAFTTGITGRIEQPPRFEQPDGRGIRHIAQVPEYRVRLAVGGPSVLHHVSVHLIHDSTDYTELPEPPDTRRIMSATDDPIVWDFEMSPDVAANTWVVITWREAYLEGIRSQAIAQWLGKDDIFWLQMYRPWSRWARVRLRNWARKHPRYSWESLRQKSVYGSWKLRKIPNALDIQGTIGPPPR